MKHQTALVLTFLAVALVFPVLSRADSDGSFCAFPGYLAYELREGITPGVTGHVLRVVRFEPQGGIHSAGEVVLRDFEVHTMNCSKDRVEISGWAKTFTKYVIDVANPQNNVNIVELTEDPAKKFDSSKERPEPPNLSQWGRPGSIPLESPDPDHKYQLLLSFSSKRVDEQSQEVHHKTELIQTDSRGNVSLRFLLFESTFVDSGD